MTDVRLRTTATLFCLCCAIVAYAQQPAVPKLVRFSGSFRPTNGTPAQTMESVTLSVYRDQNGGNALWHEIQNVVVDADGHYSVLMGATHNEGMPLDLFTGEARWLGAQFNRPGEAEQPRVLLVSVPYALKAVDAETLGGKPASAYLLAAPAVGSDTAREATGATTAVKPKVTPLNSGSPNYIGKFTNTTDLIDSSMYETGGRVGIFTTTPLISLDVRTGSLPQMGIAGTNDYLTFFASDIYGPAIYWDPAKDMRFGKGGTGLYSATGFVEQMRIQSSSGNLGIGTQTPAAKLEVNGSVQADGNVTIKTSGSGLIFPDGTKQTTAGGGTITGVTAGTDLTGGGTSGTVTLNLDTTKVPTLAAANSFTGSPNAFAGNVGIGTPTPGSRLDVAGDINFTGAIRYQGSPALGISASPSYNVALGLGALSSNSSGIFDSAIGGSALASNTTGNQNTAIGYSALKSNNAGTANTGTGNGALTLNTTGSFNTANGDHSLYNNTTGVDNTATGQGALFSNTTGKDNTANGYLALTNSTDDYNTAIGAYALAGNTTGGSSNTATGAYAMYSNTKGFNNTATGVNALWSNTTGGDSTAYGALALYSSLDSENTAIGTGALQYLISGAANTAVGIGAGQNLSGSESGNIEIGSSGTSGDNRVIRIGDSGIQSAFFAAGIYGVTTGFNNAIPVLVDSNGQLGTISSSRRFKEDIADMADASHDLMRLRPVTFRYKRPFADGLKPIQYGLIAEEVAEVYPDLVAHSADGQIETVKYQVLDSMLLNEVQRQQGEIRSLQQQINELKVALASMSGAARASNVQ